MISALEPLIASLLDELRGALNSVEPDQVEKLRLAILQANRVFLVGKGRSGLQMRGFAMRLMHMGMTTFVVDDVTTPAIAPSDLLLIGSGSGRTPSLITYATRARALSASVGLITIAESSPIVEQAHIIVHIAAPTPKLKEPGTAHSFQPMGNLFEQSLGLLLDLITVQLMETLGVTSEQMFVRHANLE